MKEATRNPIQLPLPELKELAAALAAELRSAAPIPPDVRRRFIDLRAALFLRGIYDPVLVRFDSATAPAAAPAELAEQLESVAASL
ncbi:MAG TPA: hypothetical protein VGR02_12190 [Thermoanaerobaculia bacterium]|jgi:hypothetical protein|nr:hypothetical protein [Thermoanaerobaculia bacterium]